MKPETANHPAYQCQSCGAILGTCVGRELIVGAAKFVRAVTLTCYRCFGVQVWHPPTVAKSEPATIDSKSHGL